MKVSTRHGFPAKSPNLLIRWCSGLLKIDVAAKAVTWDESLNRGKFLYISGERREESNNRAMYADVEAHRTDTEKRRMDHWRPVLDWSEQQVWGLMKEHGVDPHPAYKLGWSRLSCMACIFGDKHQWATIKELAPRVFEKISAYEKKFHRNIDAFGMNPDGTPKKEGQSVEQLAAEGTAYLPEKGPELDAIMERALSGKPWGSLEVRGENWKLPFGAFTGGGGSGPT